MPRRKSPSGANGAVTAAELLAELEADPEWVDARDAEDREVERLEAASREEQKPLLDDLLTAGVAVPDVWFLEDIDADNPAVVRVLLTHLRRPYEPGIHEGIAYQLGVKAAAPHWDEVMSMFRTADPEEGGAYQALGAALSQMATSSLLPQVRAALKDRSLGFGRIFFLRTLTRLRAPDRWDLIAEAVNDPELTIEAQHLLHQRELRLAKSKRTRSA